MPRNHATPAGIEEVLRLASETPERIAQVTHGLNEAQLHWKPDARAWPVSQALAHLRGCADVWTYSVYAMLVEPGVELARLDPRRWAQRLGYERLVVAQSLHAFRVQRAELSHVLGSLRPEGWERSAMIAGRTHTVFSQVRRMALHEREHCAQLETFVAETAWPPELQPPAS
jgi:hypothetical protein